MWNGGEHFSVDLLLQFLAVLGGFSDFFHSVR